MLDLGLSELLIILAVALIVLGPKKLPEIARTLGRSLAEVRRASDDLRRSILLEDDDHDRTAPKDPLSALSDPRQQETLSDTSREESRADSVTTEPDSSDDPDVPTPNDREPH